MCIQLEKGNKSRFKEMNHHVFKKNKNNDFLSIKIEKLIDWNEPNGEGCIVSDRITKEGFKVGYMYREVPDEDNPDSGWRF